MLKTVVIAGALVAAVAFAAPAEARHSGPSVSITGPGISLHVGTPGHYGRGHRYAVPGRVLSPRAMAHRLHRQGFHRVHDLRLRDNVYSARAQSRPGHWVRVRASAYTGEVLSVRPVW